MPAKTSTTSAASTAAKRDPMSASKVLSSSTVAGLKRDPMAASTLNKSATGAGKSSSPSAGAMMGSSSSSTAAMASSIMGGKKSAGTTPVKGPAPKKKKGILSSSTSSSLARLTPEEQQRYAAAMATLGPIATLVEAALKAHGVTHVPVGGGSPAGAFSPSSGTASPTGGNSGGAVSAAAAPYRYLADGSAMLTLCTKTLPNGDKIFNNNTIHTRNNNNRGDSAAAVAATPTIKTSPISPISESNVSSNGANGSSCANAATASALALLVEGIIAFSTESLSANANAFGASMRQSCAGVFNNNNINQTSHGAGLGSDAEEDDADEEDGAAAPLTSLESLATLSEYMLAAVVLSNSPTIIATVKSLPVATHQKPLSATVKRMMTAHELKKYNNGSASVGTASLSPTRAGSESAAGGRQFSEDPTATGSSASPTLMGTTTLVPPSASAGAASAISPYNAALSANGGGRRRQSVVTLCADNLDGTAGGPLNASTGSCLSMFQTMNGGGVGGGILLSKASTLRGHTTNHSTATNIDGGDSTGAAAAGLLMGGSASGGGGGDEENHHHLHEIRLLRNELRDKDRELNNALEALKFAEEAHNALVMQHEAQRQEEKADAIANTLLAVDAFGAGEGSVRAGAGGAGGSHNNGNAAAAQHTIVAANAMTCAASPLGYPGAFQSPPDAPSAVVAVGDASTVGANGTSTMGRPAGATQHLSASELELMKLLKSREVQLAAAESTTVDVSGKLADSKQHVTRLEAIKKEMEKDLAETKEKLATMSTDRGHLWIRISELETDGRARERMEEALRQRLHELEEENQLHRIRAGMMRHGEGADDNNASRNISPRSNISADFVDEEELKRSAMGSESPEIADLRRQLKAANLELQILRQRMVSQNSVMMSNTDMSMVSMRHNRVESLISGYNGVGIGTSNISASSPPGGFPDCHNASMMLMSTNQRTRNVGAMLMEETMRGAGGIHHISPQEERESLLSGNAVVAHNTSMSFGGSTRAGAGGAGLARKSAASSGRGGLIAGGGEGNEPLEEMEEEPATNKKDDDHASADDHLAFFPKVPRVNPCVVAKHRLVPSTEGLTAEELAGAMMVFITKYGEVSLESQNPHLTAEFMHLLETYEELRAAPKKEEAVATGAGVVAASPDDDAFHSGGSAGRRGTAKDGKTKEGCCVIQ